MSARFATGTLVDYAGARWRVQRALGVEAVLLRSESGEEVSADPLKISLTEVSVAIGPPLRSRDEAWYGEADWAEATRRRDLLATLTDKPSRTTADVAAAATSLGVTPRRVWGLLRRLQVQGDAITPFLPARQRTRAKRLSAGREAIIQQAIDQHYAKRTRPSLQSLADDVAGRCTAAGLAPPSVKAVKARVRDRDQVWLVRRREGSGKARSLALLTGSHPGADAPWERVQIDSTPCDIRLVREQARTVIGRPTLTFAIDID
jgi:putative transposase